MAPGLRYVNLVLTHSLTQPGLIAPSIAVVVGWARWLVLIPRASYDGGDSHASDFMDPISQ